MDVKVERDTNGARVTTSDAAAAPACPVRGARRAQLWAARVAGLAPLAVAAGRGGAAGHVTVSAAWALYGRLADALLAAAVVGAYAYETYQNVALHAVVFTRSKAWYLLTTAEVLATALVALLAGGGGAGRVSRLLRVARLVHAINSSNEIKAPAGRGGELVVWATLAFGVGLWPVYLALLSLSQPAATMASCALTFSANVVKVLLVLHYVCLFSLVSSSLAGLVGILNEIGLESDARGERVAEAHRRACARVLLAHRSHAALGRLLRAAGRREGPALLALLATNTLKAVHYLFWLLSVLGAPEAPSGAALAVVGCGAAAMVFEVVQTVLVVETCHRTAETLLAARPALGAVLARAPPGPLAEACAAFCAGLRGAPPAVSPLGLCTLSRAFMFEVLGFGITFAAIVRQFNLKETVSDS